MRILVLSGGIPNSNEVGSGIFERNQVKVISHFHEVRHFVINFGSPIYKYDELDNVKTSVFNFPIRFFPNRTCSIFIFNFL